jgi:hypothetical protein
MVRDEVLVAPMIRVRRRRLGIRVTRRTLIQLVRDATDGGDRVAQAQRHTDLGPRRGRIRTQVLFSVGRQADRPYPIARPVRLHRHCLWSGIVLWFNRGWARCRCSIDPIGRNLLPEGFLLLTVGLVDRLELGPGSLFVALRLAPSDIALQPSDIALQTRPEALQELGAR